MQSNSFLSTGSKSAHDWLDRLEEYVSFRNNLKVILCTMVDEIWKSVDNFPGTSSQLPKTTYQKPSFSKYLSRTFVDKQPQEKESWLFNDVIEPQGSSWEELTMDKYDPEERH